MTRDSAYLRGQLASVGILLDEPTVPLAAPRALPGPPPVDRDEVRRILVAAGAAAKDLDWLIKSCLSVEHARGYRPPAQQAWCLSCDSAQPIDAGGCVTCRDKTQPKATP